MDIKILYAAAKIAPTGEEITCPTCEKKFIKKTYQQAFCGGVCKDGYWNKVDPKKRNRKHPKRYYDKYNVGDKSAEARGIDSKGRYTHTQGGFGEWGEHGCVVERCKLCHEFPERCDCGEAEAMGIYD